MVTVLVTSVLLDLLICKVFGDSENVEEFFSGIIQVGQVFCSDVEASKRMCSDSF